MSNKPRYGKIIKGVDISIGRAGKGENYLYNRENRLGGRGGGQAV